MVAGTISKVEASWDQVFSGNLPENPARQAWREAVAEVAERAKAALPECNGRVESAVKIVLAGDVELLPDSKAKVASQSNGTTTYHVVNGECSCKDYPKATQGMCKHRIAYGIYKRAMTLTKQKLEAQLDHPNGPETHQIAPQLTINQRDDVHKHSLPEAPASANCYIDIAGRKVQVTLRDSDEGRLLNRLEALLTRFPAEDEAEQEQSESWCSKHSVQMTQHHNKKGSWWSHKTAEGWCHGK